MPVKYQETHVSDAYDGVSVYVDQQRSTAWPKYLADALDERPYLSIWGFEGNEQYAVAPSWYLRVRRRKEEHPAVTRDHLLNLVKERVETETSLLARGYDPDMPARWTMSEL